MTIYFAFALALFNLTSLRASRLLLALYALSLGAQPFTVGVLAATFSVLPMLISLQVGKLTDRVGSRWPLTLGAAGSVFGILVPFFMPGMPALFIAATMNGFSFAFYNVSLQNLVGLSSNSQNRAIHFSNYSLVLSTAAFLGPLICGFSIDHSGYGAAFICLAVLSLMAVLLLVVWGHKLPRGTLDAARKKAPEETRLDPGLWRVLATSSLLVAGTDLFQFYMPIYGHGISLSASTIGVILAMFPAASFAVRLIMPRLLARFTHEKLLSYAFYVGAASLMLVPFFKSAVVLALLSFIFGLGMGCGQPIIMTQTFGSSKRGRSGEALGWRVTVNHLTHVVSPVIFGSIASAFGLFPTFWANALMLVSGGVITRLRRSDRDSPSR